MRITSLLSLFALSALVAASPARAAVETPNGIPGGTFVNVDQAIKAGYRKVAWFRDGMPTWEGKGLPTE